MNFWILIFNEVTSYTNKNIIILYFFVQNLVKKLYFLKTYLSNYIFK